MMVTKVHKKGIVVIPKEIREKFNIKEGDEVIIYSDEYGIHILPKKSPEELFGIDRGKGLEELAKEHIKERETERAKVHP
ncbi:transcriptional regulator, AbrB family [Sulfolobus islandicus Y.G.57.14]|jgi:AbrB family looped-hinge helix DNA binding protein|uniref:Transcriptional regulator, AbrB family n=3 Tax=Saccharolobus islandicus TaxID=43080 RepID=C3MN87_SACI2|nr:AbrB/MazE/SpoVT family DNA-binding domain-containing protein [Sulfolobus islandicus]ACP36830.1 transcriptional regulator, AbrB family [Sulfolobus islandicus L.S.2.15]ACP47130.1 transcriptional regulator, AbrB family [Sulfolobus islandicus Y.G.57.14]ADB88649.1 transcriptional regulator, AbrB family [Sulfolobus islandicus L.D.8.5]PVU78115.1 AbrB/MazE/SpoVT family DNA-binding domain-containing protein [Sulfolobus islandicus]